MRKSARIVVMAMKLTWKFGFNWKQKTWCVNICWWCVWRRARGGFMTLSGIVNQLPGEHVYAYSHQWIMLLNEGCTTAHHLNCRAESCGSPKKHCIVQHRAYTTSWSCRVAPPSHTSCARAARPLEEHARAFNNYIFIFESVFSQAMRTSGVM